MLRMFRPLFVLALIAAISGGAWAECLSGELTPEQKACCVAMGHDCGAAGVEMGCCSSEPQTQDRVQVSSGKQDLVAPALVTGPLALLSEPQPRIPAGYVASFGHDTLKLSNRPTYLVLSVFRI